jgi:hypothetical protein
MPVWTPKAYAKEIKRYARERRKQIKAAALDVAHEGVAEGVLLADALGVMDRGHYKLGFKARATRNGAELRNDAPHAAVIEYGRRPGSRMPPVEAIRGWARRKGLPKGVAFLIARSIARKGIPPKALFRGHLNPILSRKFQARIRLILASGKP